MKKYNDLIGKTFGRLTVIKKIGPDKNRAIQWLCKCSCGNEHIVITSYLVHGKIKSCGCLQKEELAKRVTTHHLRNNRLYGIWANMKQRCYNSKNPRYNVYGGKGIKICDEWKNDFMSFYNWAIENGYNEKAKYGECTIDRIDVNGNYEPSNCRWIPMNKQVLNTSKNHYLELNEEKYTVYEWSIITGIKSSTILQRINKYHWSVKRALTEKPFKGKNQYYEKEVKSNE